MAVITIELKITNPKDWAIIQPLLKRLKISFVKKETSSFNRQNEERDEVLVKTNNKTHADTIKVNLIPPKITKKEEEFIYSSEVDILNKALFGLTAKEWREQNPEKRGSVRDFATIEQLMVLANLEAINADMIKQQAPYRDRILKLNEIAINQMKSLTVASIGRLKVSDKVLDKLMFLAEQIEGSSFGDPVEFQKEVRKDNPQPYRDND